MRWFLVGCTTFVIDTSLFVFFLHLTDIATISNVVSGFMATTFNYFSHYHWSFDSDRAHRQSTLFYLFFFFVFLVFGTSFLNFMIVKDVSPVYAKTGTAAIIAPVSYIVMKFITFKRESHAR